MKKHHVIDLLQTGYTTVGVIFSDRAVYDQSTESVRGVGSNTPSPKVYTYKTDQKLSVGDSVIVFNDETQAYKVVRVVRVDDEPQIDIDSDIKYKWIVQKIDRSSYDEHKEREAAALKLLSSAERQKQQQELLNQVVGNIAVPHAKQLTALLGVTIASEDADVTKESLTV